MRTRSLASVCSIGSLASLVLASACGGGSTGATPDAATSNPPDARPIEGEPYSLTFGPIDVEAGGEDTRCVTMRLDNPTAIKVRQIRNTLGDASHHFIVYRDSGASGENLTPTPCQPFAGTLGTDMAAPLMITQRAEETLTLPERVAFTFEPQQYIRLEMHYVNTGETTQQVTATAEFYAVPDTDIDHEADFLFIGSPDISLEGGEETLSAHFPLPPDLSDVSFFGITGHTHQLGTDMNIYTAPSPGGPRTEIYNPDPFLWDEPETARFEPALTVPSGGGFDFECTWQNGTGQTVEFGEDANDEMCFFWAYYYPSRGAKVCVHTDQIAGGFNGCCPDLGPSICQQLLGP